MYSFKFSEDFNGDLYNVRKRLKKYYPHTYFKFLKDLFLKLDLLKISPPMYQIYYQPNKRRIPLLYNYILIYEIQSNTIYISRILNSKQSQNNKF